MSYCTQCGRPLAIGAQFCTQCSARIGNVPAPEQPAIPSYAPVAPATATSSNKSCRNLAIGAVVVLLIVVALGIGGGIHGYRAAKEKATALLRGAGLVKPASIQPNAAVPDASSRSAAPDASATPSSFAPWKPTSPDAASDSEPAPLRAGMLLVTAIADMSGDYESFKQITSIDPDGVNLSYRSERPKSGPASSSSPTAETTASRKVLNSDLASAHDYAELFGSNDPPSFPGSTAVSASREVLAELKQKGTSQFSFRPDGLKGSISSLVNVLSAIGGNDAKNIGDGSLANMSKEECALQRLGNGDFALPILLNGEPTTLPALHAHCTTDDGPANFYILDQPSYPLMLSWKLGQGSQLQVIKITYPAQSEKKAAPKMEQELAENKKVEIYGIYFDFASDRLKPESTPVLSEIARVMQNHPDWKLFLSGHTDNIGGDAYNLDLSRRRAAAVKQALAMQYRIALDRLTTDGYGASCPLDTNETLEGRARNRRVELMRE